MESERIAVGDCGYSLLVSEFNNFLMIHIRKFYQAKPKNFGLALTPKEWKILLNKTEKLTVSILILKSLKCRAF